LRFTTQRPFIHPTPVATLTFSSSENEEIFEENVSDDGTLFLMMVVHLTLASAFLYAMSHAGPKSGITDEPTCDTFSRLFCIQVLVLLLEVAGLDL